MRFRRAMLLSGLLALVSSHLLLAADARVTALSGTVSFQRASALAREWAPASVGLSLLPGDAIRTGSDGSATLLLSDGSIVSVKPDTLFSVPAPVTADQPVPPAPPGGSASRPAGVSADRWLSLGTDVGIALSASPPRSGPSLEGTLFIRQRGAWIPVHLTAPPADPRQVIPAH